MNDRERFIACVTGQPLDRVPYWLFWSPWDTTWQRWERECKPEQFATMADVRKHYCADQTPHSLPVNCGPCPRIERTVIEEDVIT